MYISVGPIDPIGERR